MTFPRSVAKLVIWAVVAGPLMSPPASAQTSTPWRRSWEALRQALDDYRTRGSTLPTPSFQGFLKGERIAATDGVMKAFNGQVVFQGTLDSLVTDPAVLMDGMTVKLGITILGKGFKHIYPAQSSLEAWRTLEPGSPVRFRATLTGLTAIHFPDGQYGFGVTLENAAIVK